MNINHPFLFLQAILVHQTLQKIPGGSRGQISIYLYSPYLSMKRPQLLVLPLIIAKIIALKLYTAHVLTGSPLPEPGHRYPYQLAADGPPLVCKQSQQLKSKILFIDK